MAHPRANGFFGASLPAGGIPSAYTLIASKFFAAIGRSGQHDRIRLFEYLRDGWTFHGKGLWYAPPGEQAPLATMIGKKQVAHCSCYILLTFTGTNF
jgi:CDP-diacylglycerol--glycerol-3-phosphate 3-phosphatidyltransferase